MLKVWYENGGVDKFIEMSEDKSVLFDKKLSDAIEDELVLHVDIDGESKEVLRVDWNDEEIIFMSPSCTIDSGALRHVNADDWDECICNNCGYTWNASETDHFNFTCCERCYSCDIGGEYGFSSNNKQQ